jgi:hypothetical protein
VKTLHWVVAGTIAFTSSVSFGGDVETRVATAFASSYAQEQLKHQLAEFLDKNPRIVFSSNPTIGTQGMRFLSQALSAYNLLTAKTDRERAWSAAYLILSPEPTTAAALFAAQMIDTLLTMKAERDLARIYEEIAEIQAQTSSIVTKLATQDYNSQIAYVQKFESTLEQVDHLQGSLMSDPLYVALQTQGDLGSLNPDAVQSSIVKLAQLREVLIDLDVATLYIQQSVRVEELGLRSDFIENCIKSNTSFDPLRDKIDSLRSSFYYFFGSLQAERLKEKVRRDQQPHAALLRVYLRCVEVANIASSRHLFGEKPLDVAELSDCRSRFKSKGL